MCRYSTAHDRDVTVYNHHVTDNNCYVTKECETDGVCTVRVTDYNRYVTKECATEGKCTVRVTGVATVGGGCGPGIEFEARGLDI